MSDLIDRGKAIQSLYGITMSAEGTIPLTAALFAIHHTPSAEQTTAERRGHWKECKSAIPIPMETLHIADGIMFCSECEYLALQRLVYEDGNGDLKFIKSKYCPNCGARMEEEE